MLAVVQLWRKIKPCNLKTAIKGAGAAGKAECNVRCWTVERTPKQQHQRAATTTVKLV
jgi:hypothetical protein